MRKGFCLILVLFLSAIRGYGQTNVYHPFPDSGAVWRMQIQSLCEPIISPTYCTTEYQYVLKGDTMLNGIKYNKLYYEALQSSCIPVAQGVYTCSSPVFISYYNGAIRNDSLLRKVYINSTGLDILLYDFSLNVGDSVNFLSCSGKIISSIDSVLVGSIYRKRFILDNNSSIIEGIGSVGSWAGLFDGCGVRCVCNIAWGFICFSQNGIPLYPDTSTCSIINGIEQTKSLSTINIYPNPTTSQLNITSPTIIDKIEITDVMGRLIYRAKPNDKVCVMDLQNEGIYFVSVTMGEQRVVRKVVVVR